MLDIKFIRENPDMIKDALQKRNVVFDVGYLIEVDEKRRTKIKEVEEMRAEQNRLSDEIEKLNKDETRAQFTLKVIESKVLKNRLGEADFELKAIEEEFAELMYLLPNIPLPETPLGKDEHDNLVLREWGKKRDFTEFSHTPHDYMTIAGSFEYDLIDTARAAKVSGSRFGYLKNDAVLLEFALVQFALDHLMKQGFIPVIPPVIVREEIMRGMGYIDSNDDREERYELNEDKLFLVGTSEQSVVPMHTEEILDEKDLPLRYIAFSSCFRREAGSYGKDTYGILRVHQFDKIEMVSFTKSEDSAKEHEFLLAMEEELMQALEIPYRVRALCTGDIARPSARTIDIEAWLPGQNNGQGEYRETHSSSNTTDFQARRLNIKYRPDGGIKSEFVHILNGTAFAIGRMIIAILENGQNPDGSIIIPKVLRPYMGGRDKIQKIV